MEIMLEKYQGCGNDYFILDPNKQQCELTQKMIQQICNRNFGFGSDGILYGPIFEGEKPIVKILNPDGSEAEKSGNGVRIFAKYLKDAGYVQKKSAVVHTLDGEVEVKYLDESGNRIRANMGKASFKSSEIPVTGPEREVIDEEMIFGGKKYYATCVSVGNPHCILQVNELSKERIEKIGPFIETSSYFPNRINVHLMKVLDRKNLQIEIYERGAGYTLSSGTSACAVAAAAYRLGLADTKVNVHMQGGSMVAEIADSGDICLTGDVERIGRLIWEY